MKVYQLRSQDTEEIVFQSIAPIQKTRVKEAIVKHLIQNPKDTLEWGVGDNILGFYEINKKNGKPSLVITKGEKEYYKALI